MKVALDLEDVLVESNAAFIEELRDFIEENHPEAEFEPLVTDLTGWRFEGIRSDLAELQGWNGSEIEKFFEGDANGWRGFHPITEEIWRENPERYEVIPEKIEDELSKLKEAVEDKGGELYLVTARQNVNDAVKDRLDDLNIREFFEDVIFKISKDELDFDIYIDDYPHLHEKLDSGVHIMVDKPWNQSQDLGNPHTRVSGIEEATEVIKDLDR